MTKRELIESQLLLTWQPVAAIAARCDMPIKTCLTELLILEDKGIVKKARVRIDGHNKVHLFKKIEYVQILGQRCIVNAEEVEA